MVSMRLQTARALLTLATLSAFELSTSDTLSTKALSYLYLAQDRYSHRYGVYDDANMPDNHFVTRGKITGPGDEAYVPAMNEFYSANPHSGLNCIYARFLAHGDNFGGWSFQNGYLKGSDHSPHVNWGDVQAAGVDLTGATRLTFSVKGVTGGEKVTFFLFGNGWINHGIVKHYPDSNDKVAVNLTLTKEWKTYAINLSGKNLSYVLNGFGWSCSAQANGNKNVSFFLDDIGYDFDTHTKPGFLSSYEVEASNLAFDKENRNVGFLYDNSLAALAFLAANNTVRARRVADAIVYAQSHDRFFSDGRLRNSVESADLVLPPGWRPNNLVGRVRTPGWYDPGSSTWIEDTYMMSSDTGNLAWAMIALLAVYDKTHVLTYRSCAVNIGEWLQTHCWANTGVPGYTGGDFGNDTAASPQTYKSTEHNIDLYVALRRLYLSTGAAKWSTRANLAKVFVVKMWDPVEKKFWTGTLNDGKTINKQVVPLDVQAWSHLAFESQGTPYLGSLAYAEAHHAINGGYDFNTDRDGVWFEGTGQMACTYRVLGQTANALPAVQKLLSAQNPDGGMWAADKNNLTTGFAARYFHRLHVAATAWAFFAGLGVNPYWIGR